MENDYKYKRQKEIGDTLSDSIYQLMNELQYEYQKIYKNFVWLLSTRWLQWDLC